MIKIYLSRLLGEKRWPQARLAHATGIRPATICQWYNEFADRINLEHLDKICEALDCSVADLLEHIPNDLCRTGKDLIVDEFGKKR